MWVWPISGVWGRRSHQSVHLESPEYQGLTQGSRTVGVANIWGVGKAGLPVNSSRITGVPRTDTRKQDYGCGQFQCLGCEEEVSPVSLPAPLSLEVAARRLTDDLTCQCVPSVTGVSGPDELTCPLCHGSERLGG